MAVRFHDLPVHAFWNTRFTVVCPACGNAASVFPSTERPAAIFQCPSCFAAREATLESRAAFEITAQCTSTGHYFRLSLPPSKIRGPKARVRCPYCGESAVGSVCRKTEAGAPVFQDPQQPEDPYFHYPLYFQAAYRGHPIWARNREHLQYLIQYLSADLRTVQPDFYEVYQTLRSQSNLLPAFLKSAKNRAGIIKLLTKLQQKESPF